MIKIISFDIGNTLITSKSSKLKKIEIILNKSREKFRKEYKESFLTNEKEIQEQILDFINRLSLKNIDKEKYKKIIKLFDKHRKRHKRILKSKIKIIKKLKKNGYKIIAFSNCCKYSNNLYLEKIGLFEQIIYSYQIGYYKPQPEAFKFIEEKMNVAPNEILHIGDSLNSDYYASIKQGWNALLYDPKNKCKDNKIVKIKSFKEIELYLT